MARETTFIRPKLHRPPVPRDHVHRARLLEHLEQRRERPLTLVSALPGAAKAHRQADGWKRPMDTVFVRR